MFNFIVNLKEQYNNKIKVFCCIVKDVRLSKTPTKNNALGFIMYVCISPPLSLSDWYFNPFKSPIVLLF